MVIHLITEGPTDQIALRHILSRYFSNPDIDIRPLQPNVDSSDPAEHFGGWGLVLDYCKSPEMLSALEVEGYMLIQLDTDVCEEYGVARRMGAVERTADQIIEEARNVIINSIGAEIYEAYKSKIIFAISFESIECWLLPIYFTDSRRSKTINCCETLNQELIKKEGFTIDCHEKKPHYYSKICRSIKTRAQIETFGTFNASFLKFIQQLEYIKSKTI